MSAHKRFCHPAVPQFSIAAVFFITACKELEIAQIDQLYHLLNLTCAYDYAFYQLPRMLMSKNVNKVSSTLFCLILKIQIFWTNIAINDLFRGFARRSSVIMRNKPQREEPSWNLNSSEVYLFSNVKHEFLIHKILIGRCHCCART